MNFVLILSLFLSIFTLQARQAPKHHHYYGSYAQVFQLYKPHILKKVLHKILSHDHIRINGQSDIIENSKFCPTNLKGCYRHIIARPPRKQPGKSYTDAKKVLYQYVTPMKVGTNEYVFNPIYHKKPIRIKAGPNYRFSEIVNRNGLNAEHVWPQSKFGGNKKSPKNRYKRSDLHHLFPCNSRTNSHRGSFPFGETRSNQSNTFGVVIPQQDYRHSNHYYFMPIPNSRGRVARAMMYFSTRYNMPISALQEFYIRKWHREYPVTKEEIYRNEMIFKFQQVRNPFIDYPQLEAHIADF